MPNVKAEENQSEHITLLVKQCKNGDQHAFKALYDQYVHAMYNTSYRILNSHADVQDAVQESFTRAFKQLHQFEGRSSFGSWLKRIVVNKSINILRNRRVDLWDEDQWEARSHQNWSTHSDPPDLGLTVGRITKSIQMLPDGYRTVLTLFLVEGYDHKEIAQILNVAESTTRTQYIRAKKKLIHILDNQTL